MSRTPIEECGYSDNFLIEKVESYWEGFKFEYWKEKALTGLSDEERQAFFSKHISKQLGATWQLWAKTVTRKQREEGIDVTEGFWFPISAEPTVITDGSGRIIERFKTRD